MTAYTRADARHFLYDHSVVGPSLGMYGTASVVAPTQLTDLKKFGNENYGSMHFAGQAKIILPNRTGADQQKEAGELFVNNGLSDLGHASPTNWSTTWNNEPWELVYGGTGDESQVTWDQLNAAAKRALKRCDGARWLPVGPWRDALGRDNSDFSFGVGEWAASGAGLTIAPSSDRAHNDTGNTTMLLAASQASRYAYHLLGVPCLPSQTFWLSGLPIMVAGGPLTFEIWDYTNNAWVAQIGSTITATGAGSHLHHGLAYQVPSGCYLLNARIGLANGCTAAIDALPGHGLHWRSWKTPDAMDKGYKLRSLVRAQYDSVQDQQYVSDAQTRKPQAYRQKTDYIPQNTRGESSPNSIQWTKDGALPAADLWYIANFPASSRVSFDDDIESADINVEQYEASVLIEAARMLEARDQLGRNGKWQALEAQNEALFAVEDVADEPVTPPAVPERMWFGR